MENVKIEIGVEEIKVAMQEAAKELFKSSYSNPIKKLLEKSIEEKTGEIKKIVDEIVVLAITDPKFKTQIADAVINGMVQNALKANR